MSTIVVTGASKGLGLAITTYLLADHRKHRLIVCCNSDDKPLKALANDPDNTDRVFIIKGDTSDANFAKTVFAQSLVHFDIDRIDALVLNHGTIGDGKRLADSSQEEWETCFRINVFSYVGIIQHTIAFLRESQGRIILTSSGAADSGISAWGAYGASKAAVNHIGKTLANEERAITTVAIRPGKVDTAMQGLIRGDISKNMNEDEARVFIEAHRDGKLLPPEKPGNVMARLAIEAKKDLSGLFLTWNDPQLAEYQDK